MICDLNETKMMGTMRRRKRRVFEKLFFCSLSGGDDDGALKMLWVLCPGVGKQEVSVKEVLIWF